MKVGFSGTRKGMTPEQLTAFRVVMEDIIPTGAEFHHGDCLGADKQAHGIATELGMKTIVHPPVNPSMRAYCKGTESRDKREYLERNKNIVNETTLLIACPSGMKESGGGTWYTVRYAKSKKHDVFIVFPDGSVRLCNK